MQEAFAGWTGKQGSCLPVEHRGLTHLLRTSVVELQIVCLCFIPVRSCSYCHLKFFVVPDGAATGQSPRSPTSKIGTRLGLSVHSTEV